MRRQESGWLWETAKVVIYAVAIAITIRTFAFEPFNIPSGSMIPNLLVGDYLFVAKYAYGYSRYSLPLGLPLIPGRILSHPPERGDIVVFKKPTDRKTDFIKRLIGLPGDRIQVKNAILYINDQAVPRRQIEDYMPEDAPPDSRGVPQFVETLPNGRSYRIIEVTPNGGLDNTGVYVVPEDHYFMMGDNRENSMDSRVLTEVGYVPAENLVGRAEFLFFSLHNASGWEFWKWPFSTRYGRLLRPLEP
jgi:signal peptidase I